MPSAPSSEIRSRVGQLFIIGFDGAGISSALTSLITRIQPSGVILFARNIINAQQAHKLLKDCQACVREPLFTCVDLEGGRVDRFRDALGPSPSAAEVFATADAKLFRKHGEIIGRASSAMGFNVDLAPVLDLAFEASKSVMSSRAFSTDPKSVVHYAREFVQGLARADVIGAGKHFPGLGEGNLDSHHDLPVIKKSFRKLWDEDLVPYRQMKRQLPMVLVNHANYPAVTGDGMPASLSKKWITDVLRRRIGYRGLVLSDDLEMGGVLKVAPIDRAAVEFIRAGGDLCLVCRKQEYVEQAFEAVVREFERDAGFRRRAQESAKRILLFKTKRPELRRRIPAPSPEKISRLSTQLWEFSERVRLQALSTGASGARA
jgi:beta-N-acetylhexosaminidase